jgi:superfamily II DNA or RNA helicase
MATSVNRNNTSFQAQLKEALKAIPFPFEKSKGKGKEKDKNNELLYHQKLKLTYMLNHPEQRGLFIIDDPGYGKTRSAAAIAEELLKDGYKVLVVAASSLHANTENGVFQHKRSLPENDKKTDHELREEIKNTYTFISLNASNMATQLERVAKTGSPKLSNKKNAEEINIDEKLEAMLGQVDSLEGYAIIVDESHNLFNSMTNSESKNSKKFYEIVMNTKKIKLIFLTGTPIVNDPFELVPCFNMIAGRDQNGKTLFPEDYEEFHRYFVGNGEIKNKDKFQNRILGLVSYNGILYEDSVESQTGRKDVIARKGFPDEAPTIVERVNMSTKQYADYILAKHKEDQETSRIFGQKAKIALAKPAFLSSSTYKVHTRQISNFLIPAGVKEKEVDQINDSAWKSLEIYSPKYKAIIKNMKKYKTNVVYSQFKGPQGIGGLIKALEVNEHFSEYQLSESMIRKAPESSKASKGNHKFIKITGDTPQEDRQKLLDILKMPNNKYGDIIEALFVTAAGAEGIDTTNMMATHMVEPYWNPSREDQFKARAIRINSHNDLPTKERIVQPYIYLSIPPADIIEGSKKEGKILDATTDEVLYQKATNARKGIMSFRYALIEASIDCLQFNDNNTKNNSTFSKMELKCKICQPTNEPLFHDFMDDMNSVSACKPYIEEQIAVKEIIVEGRKYYYKKPSKLEIAAGESLEVFEYSEVLDAYSPVDEQDPVFDMIKKKILKQ